MVGGSEKNKKVRQKSRAIAFEATETARAKVLRQHCAWQVGGTAEKPVMLKQSDVQASPFGNPVTLPLQICPSFPFSFPTPSKMFLLERTVDVITFHFA